MLCYDVFCYVCYITLHVVCYAVPSRVVYGVTCSVLSCHVTLRYAVLRSVMLTLFCYCCKTYLIHTATKSKHFVHTYRGNVRQGLHLISMLVLWLTKWFDAFQVIQHRLRAQTTSLRDHCLSFHTRALRTNWMATSVTGVCQHWRLTLTERIRMTPCGQGLVRPCCCIPVSWLHPAWSPQQGLPLRHHFVFLASQCSSSCCHPLLGFRGSCWEAPRILPANQVSEAAIFQSYAAWNCPIALFKFWKR